MRYFVEIAYNGKNYHGWQIQPDAMSVQQVIEEGLSLLMREPIKVTGAGRTDTGVHARQLFAHFDTGQSVDTESLHFRLNSYLPKDISVQGIRPVQADAHARFDAFQRSYEYHIITTKDPFRESFAYRVHKTPDVDLMNAVAKCLLSHNDFQCFSRSKTDVKTYHCKVIKAQWKWNGPVLIFSISADRFLRNMVRAIVGTLLEVGYGKMTEAQFQQLLDSKDRTQAGPSAPAHGLYLTRVHYPETIELT